MWHTRSNSTFKLMYLNYKYSHRFLERLLDRGWVLRLDPSWSKQAGRSSNELLGVEGGVLNAESDPLVSDLVWAVSDLDLSSDLMGSEFRRVLGRSSLILSITTWKLFPMQQSNRHDRNILNSTAFQAAWTGYVKCACIIENWKSGKFPSQPHDYGQ